MKTKIIVVIAAIGYAAGFMYDPFLFFPIGLTAFYIFLLSKVLYFLVIASAALFPKSLRTTYTGNKKKLNKVTLACSAFLYLGAWAINRYFLPHKLHPISLLTDVVILLFTIFLGWGLADLRKRKTALSAGVVIFTVFICAASYSSFRIYQYREPSSLEALKSLPYLTWVPEKDVDAGKTGVTKYDPDLSCQGLNVYTRDKDTTAYLMDMSGKDAHTWLSEKYQWHHVKMYGNGDLLGIVEDKSLVKLDWDSNVIWEKKMRFHHDADVAENKDIYTLARKDEIVFYNGLPLPVLNSYILVLSDDGKIKQAISLFKILKGEIPKRKINEIYSWLIKPHTLLYLLENKKDKHFALEGWIRCPADVFHVNNVGVITKDIEGLCKKGDLLICARNLDFVGILDVKKEKFIWQWGRENLRMPHNPTMLESGNILIFDNGWEREYSRIVEVNPITKKIVWEYKATPPEQFFSLMRGASERLPNGNTLITESDKGRVFEITPTGEIVWEFYSPLEEKDGKQARKAIYRMMRITDNKAYPCLERLR
ncbi:MAG: hypothetical protein COS99_03085 [Candidatus Omnitrophica bacterium CG07_land_8_20_14_0_80_42_15]|uniref:Aryl sulfotransferase n=1 Tax=Candidatus Aquitaenariimonas noxiae TaxID=1974741 RepID=A0A2J0L3L9_9BACT|nr:MAG: hypothetical protein COS99_03085 [Candidatus Omnitrophica bacterium CG07_land_8_20_14_0_80_42_15]